MALFEGPWWHPKTNYGHGWIPNLCGGQTEKFPGHSYKRASTMPCKKCGPLRVIQGLRVYDGPAGEEMEQLSPGVLSYSSSPSSNPGSHINVSSSPDDAVDRVDWAHQCRIKKVLESLTESRPDSHDHCRPINFDRIANNSCYRHAQFTSSGRVKSQPRRVGIQTASAVSCPEFHRSKEHASYATIHMQRTYKVGHVSLFLKQLR
jgi:hypothetical protein